MELDVKTILIVISVLTICILICILGTGALEKNENTVNVAVQNFSLVQNVTNTTKTEGSRIEKVENNVTTDTYINTVGESSNTNNPNEDKPIEKNNTYPYESPEIDFVKRQIDYSRLGGKTLCYKIPRTWGDKAILDEDPVTGADIENEFSLLSNFGTYDEDTTYEEFLNDFMKKEKEADFYADRISFRTRKIYINEYNELTILEKIGSNVVSSYIVLVQDDGVYWLEITVLEEKYTDEYVKTIDAIFSTAYVGIF